MSVLHSPSSHLRSSSPVIFQEILLHVPECVEAPEQWVAEHILASPGAQDQFQFLNPFLVFCSMFFTRDHVARIRQYYADLEPELYALACTATHGSVAVALASEAFHHDHNGPEAMDADDGQEWKEGRISAGGGGGQLGGGCGGDEKDGGTQGGQGRGGGGDRRGARGRRGGRGRGGRAGDPSKLQAPPQAIFFQNAPRSTFRVVPFTTPPKEQLSTVRDLAARLGDNSTIKGLLDQRYSPFEDEETANSDTQRILIHGTRSSFLPRFCSSGIFPLPQPNTLAIGPAFYTTSDPRVAYMHTLVHHPRVMSPDPVIFLVFSISPSILHGDVPFDGRRLTNLWFEGETEEQVDQLIQHGSNCHNSEPVLIPLLAQTDIIIAPHLVPALGKSVRIARYDFGGSHEQPTQVAAATQAAWLYFAASIKKILIEDRGQAPENR
ncbi:hypothetical protein B0H13DRAFT_1959066 [Mycena leptocephala]|nr:hypothetical protein B0H13DRAFT_1959066 [Mycena leptocephala]